MAAYISIEADDHEVEDGGRAGQHVHAQPDEAQLAAGTQSTSIENPPE